MFKKFFNKPLIAITAHLLLAVTLLYIYTHSMANDELLGLGEGTATYRPLVDSFPIHITEVALTDRLKEGWENRGAKELTLWFGNSQLHGVNKYKEGQKNCVEYCYYSLLPRNKTVLGISYPNANFRELLLSIVYHSTRFPRLKRIVLPVFYDDMREDDIRERLLTDEVRKFIESDTVGPYFSPVRLLSGLRSPAPTTTEIVHELPAEQETDETIQSKTESWLEQGLSERWSLWKVRPDIRSNLFYDLYNTRNYLLGINSGTERKMIPGIFQDNYRAFEQILLFCRDKKIELVLYIPPIRPDVKLPYNKKEYAAFKTAIEQKAKTFHAVFLNLENLVPAKWWSQHHSRHSKRETDIDFMHFQEPGHKLLGDTMFSILKN